MKEKLIRDKIPSIVLRKGERMRVRIAEPHERLGLLCQKLLEETKEFLETPCYEELADVQEVVNALAKQLGSFDTLKTARETKRRVRGGFDEFIVLVGSPHGQDVMGWATGYIERLRRGETVSFRPTGNSMTPRIKSGQLCTVEPVRVPESIKKDDVVLCRVNGSEYLHIVKAARDGSFQIGNNHGKINGWTKAVFGKLVSVEP